MTLNFLNFGGKLSTVHKCFYDSNVGYSIDLSIDGDVDGWTYYDGIHTYGSWNGFLFGTVFKDYACVGMANVITPIKAEVFYNIRIVMKLSLKERYQGQVVPTEGRIMWRTVSSTAWNSEKSKLFSLKTGDGWDNYEINMSDHTMWQGDINDLRIFPISSNGRIGDEFFIRSIEIYSNGQSVCSNALCNFYNDYTSNCRGVGSRAVCISNDLPYYMENNNLYKHKENRLFNITKSNNELIVDINGYGEESIKLQDVSNCKGSIIASMIANELSKVGIGGYSEVQVEYKDTGSFSIFTGTYTSDSTVVVKDSTLARYIGFYDPEGNINYKTKTGSSPASGFKELSSFKIKTSQLYSIVDSNNTSNFSFDPKVYNIEIGRRDWLVSGLGEPSRDVRGSESDVSGLMNRYIDYLSNAGTTVIDFNHPANSSGRIKKIFAAVTLDTTTSRGAADSNRKKTQLSDACVMFFRPNKNGDLKVLDYEIPIKNREHETGKLYSSSQEYIEIDCDIFVNEGDLIGIYNANVYVGRSITGKEIDATFYQINGKPVAGNTLKVDTPIGSGSSGIMVYARSDCLQDRLVISTDFGKRVNINSIKVLGESSNSSLDFNIARCVDVNWEVDLFGGDHTTGYETENYFMPKVYYSHPNIAYGVNCLNDGIKTVPDGIAADSFSVSLKTYYEAPTYRKDGGAGVIPVNPKYFHCNGDLEWIGVYMLAGTAFFALPEFQEDPIAFTIRFPMGTEKTIYKSKIYFKERYNFRNFGLSTYIGDGATTGDADNKSFKYIPNRSGHNTPWVRVNLDGIDYLPEDKNLWSNIDLYLAENPCNGEAVIKLNKVKDISYDPILANYSDDGGLQYSAGGVILNNDQFVQATATDWTTIEHEWEPIKTKGFRIYCDSHKSTKICEMELYCKVDDIRVPIGSSIDAMYSDYGDYWWSAQGVGGYNEAEIFIGDSPQYVNISIKPINNIKISFIDVNISNEDFNFGDSFCSKQLLPIETKIGSSDNVAVPLTFKNIYGPSYNLYVDIIRKNARNNGITFYSLLSDDNSIKSPEIGPSAYYKKHPEYIFKNYNKNVAINCPVYALRNIAKGSKAWRTYDKDYSWQYFGVLETTHNTNFVNLPNMTITTINLPNVVRSKWWKIGFLDNRIVSNVREIQVYYKDTEIAAKFYYSKDQDVNFTPNNDPAPHINNHIIDGSYYILGNNAYIGIELPSTQEMDKIIIYHDRLLEYESSHDKAGIDSATALCIIGEGSMYQTDSIVDYSYYEHPITIDYGKIYCDNKNSPTIYYDFSKDFLNCESLTKNFDDPYIDYDFWEDAVNVTVASGVMNIHNYSNTGSINTINYYDGDFNTSVTLSIEGAYDRPGWGCYLQIETGTGSLIRVGREYSSTEGYNCFSSYAYGPGGWEHLYAVKNSDITNMVLRLFRTGNTIGCYAKSASGSWWNMGTSPVIGYSLVKIKLISIYTPITNGLTLAKFDNFFIDKSDSSWSINNSFDTTFTCVSGVGPSGSACVFDIACGNYSDAASYKKVELFDVQNKPLDNEYVFILDFAFKMDSFLTTTGESTNNCGVSVGILDRHEQSSINYYFDYQDYFIGAQVVIKRDNIGIAVRNLALEYSDKFTNLQTRANTYFCRFLSDGAGSYSCHVWTDTWGGAVKVVELSMFSSIKWIADKVGFGSGFSTYDSFTSFYRASGWISDIDFQCSKTSKNYIIGNSSIRFDNSKYGLIVHPENSGLCDINKDGFYLLDKRFTVDFYIKFNKLPRNHGEIVYLAASWDTSVLPVAGQSINNNCSWAFVIEVDGASIYWRLYLNINGICVRAMNYRYTPDLHRWDHYYLSRGSDGSYSYMSYIVLFRDGRMVYSNGSSGISDYSIRKGALPISIGSGLDGWISNFRISNDRTQYGCRTSTVSISYQTLSKRPPTSKYERYYTYSFYSSADNIFYGKAMDVDVLFSNSKSYRMQHSLWSEYYYSYFAVDLGQRYAIDIIRSYPVDTSYQFSSDANVIYSNKDVDDPVQAFNLEDEESNVNDDFSGENGSFPSNWSKNTSFRAYSYIKDGMLLQACFPNSTTQFAESVSKFMLSGDFGLNVDFDIGDEIINKESWSVSLSVRDVNNRGNIVKLSRTFFNNKDSIILSYKYNGTWTTVFNYTSLLRRGTLRIIRKGYVFSAYIKDSSDPVESFQLLGIYHNTTGYGIESEVILSLESMGSVYPDVTVLWDNFRLEYGNVIYSNKMDARWLKIKMLNGDGVTRKIVNFDVFPNTTINKSPSGGYNTYWDYIGTSVTSYSSGENIAQSTTVSGSSYVSPMIPENAVNGVIGDNSINSVWGSSDEANPWLAVYFDELQPIYRIKVYHGYDVNDSNNIVTDYDIQYSTDNSNYINIFNITGNSSYERTHDLLSPIYVRSIRIYINSYKALSRFINTNNGHIFWRGAVLREIEVYKYYGYNVVNSEDTPIIAIDLKNQYYIEGHSLVGIDAESTLKNWSNADSNFSWSNNRLSDPSKVTFSPWGTSPLYERWVLIKRNTATNYPLVPTTTNPETDKIDYLKHVVINGSSDNSGLKPNPIEYYWMWESNISELSNDYSLIGAGKLGSKTLKISYPVSTDSEHVRFIEGDHFGWDENCSIRDGLGMNIYISNIEDINLDYGYIYVGGFDYTESENPVVFKWYIKNIKQALRTGWNQLYLCFMYADDLSYTKLSDLSKRDPRRLYSIKWGRMGIVFSGLGRELQINIEGTYIARNYFAHAAYPGQYGLYLHNQDFLKVKVSDMNFGALTVEFWIRPDWDITGRDLYKDYKLRTLFHMSNNSNDIFGAQISNRGIEVYYGNVMTNLNTFVIGTLPLSILNKLVHFGFVCSNTGKGIDSDGSTIRVYVNNSLIGKITNPWEITDNKHVEFILGGRGVLPLKQTHSSADTSAVDGVVSRLKLHNVCKKNFEESIVNLNSTENDHDPNAFISISRDNVTFYDMSSEELPLVFENVGYNDEVTVWTKVKPTKEARNMDNRTASIISSWDIGV